MIRLRFRRSPIGIDELDIGDHICRPTSGDQMHHGIVSGLYPTRVIHFNTADGSKDKSKATVIETSLKSFMSGERELDRMTYNLRRSIWLTMEIARGCKESYPPYHVTANNCEHFCTFCTTGIPYSEQAGKGVGVFGIGVGALMAPPIAIAGGIVAIITHWNGAYIVRNDRETSICGYRQNFPAKKYRLNRF
jgi:hypothetical protein